MAEPATPGELAGGEGAADRGASADATADATADTAPAEPGPEPAAPGSESPSGIIGVLLHTEPPLSVSEVAGELGVGKAAAHMVVAGRKALDAMIDGTTGSGTTVVEHVIAGAVELATNASADGDADEPEENAPVPVDGGPA
jgi:hypothetical protein